MKWKIEYDNDTGPNDDYFREWWNITDGETSFECSNEEKANWLCDKLNSESQHPSSPEGWVSVEDGLPEYDQVIDTWNGKVNRRCVFLEYGKRFTRHVEPFADERIYVVYYEDITHWQPLPPAPLK